MTYIEKTSYFEVAPPGHTIAYKNVDNLLKKQLVYILIGYVTYKYDVQMMFKFSLMYLKEF